MACKYLQSAPVESLLPLFHANSSTWRQRLPWEDGVELMLRPQSQDSAALLTPPLTKCLTLRSFLDISGPQFPRLENGHRCESHRTNCEDAVSRCRHAHGHLSINVPVLFIET